ncbi:class I adenylate-forming enzyme family protein [Cupriavidus sp. AU9028]|uniref:class I adenylate-forming enzyme family protein n=1 Tax=Cupriavidus sp. AU9028 TaxID=2871157 RepID=UPI001C97D42A|nr:class I adenylate-forming enzyme family protein [Cupriavidus sp. AU9028]MBY4897054.1 acyl--CoA ligase [Cupriavidus sp. AU9028]
MRQDIDNLLAQPFGSIPALIERQAARRPDHPALILDDERLDFAGLRAGMERVAATLQRNGVGPGHVIAICAGTSFQYLLAFLGALRAGVAVAPLAPSATADHLSAMLDNCGATLVMRDQEVARQWPVQARPGLQCVALDDRPEAGQPWSRWLATGEFAPEPIAPERDWPFNVIYSSGTTGVPKGIVQSWAMRWAHVHRAVANGYGPDAVSLCATPLYSNTTLVAALPTLALGGTLVLMRKFSATRFLALAQAHRATHTMLVPVQYQRLLQCPEFDQTDLSALQHKFCTSAPFSAALKAEVLRRWPGTLIEYYGMTEGGVRCELHCHAHPDKLHTVGRPAAGAEVRFIDEHGNELPPGAQGEIVGRSAGMMSGYYREPERSREAEWHDRRGIRFIRSGDIGRLDDDGFIVLSDRRKDMIITGGFNVYPSDIESVLLAHPDVGDCAVIAVPSQQWGETPVAYAVPRQGAQPEAELLRDWLNARVGKIQRVSALFLVKSLPRSEIGKVLKRDLREQYLQSQSLNAETPLPGREQGDSHA